MTMTSFKPWSGAVGTWDRLEREGLVNKFFTELEVIGYEQITETQLNDMLWFEPKFCYELVGLDYNEDEE